MNADSGRQAKGHRWVVLGIMCAGMFLVLLDVTIVNVALPSLGDVLHSDLAGLQWVVDGYTVALAALLLAGGTLGDLHGHRRVVVVGLGVFGAASLACGLAPNLGLLVAARVLQGAGAALLLPCTLAVITHSFPRARERARALGVWAGVSSLALPTGPLLGGLLVTVAGWRSVYLVNVPVVAVALVATWRYVPPTGASRSHRLDLVGVLTCATALACLVTAVISWGRSATSSTAPVAAGAGILAFVCFLLRERRARWPLLPLTLLRSRAFVGANAVAAGMNFVGIGTIFLATLYLQLVRHQSPLRGGLELLPLFLPLALLSPVTGRLTARFGPRLPMVAGLSVGAAGLACLLLPGAASGFGALLPALLGLGVGMGLLTAAVVAAAMDALPKELAGLAGGVNNTARQAAGALGIATFGAVAGSPAQAEHFVAGLHLVGVLAAGLWLFAVAITVLTVPSRPRVGAG